MKKKIACQILQDYVDSKIKFDCYINLPTPLSILGQNVLVPVAVLNLNKVRPKEDILEAIKKISRSQDEFAEVEMIDLQPKVK